MKKLYRILLVLALGVSAIAGNLHAQAIGADTLISHRFGGGEQKVGQEAEYFPGNVFGFPDTNATEKVPAVLPESVCSLGFGGEIVLGFSGKVLTNGDGCDFIIFENAFYSKFTSKLFAEPAVVSVSQDGVNFFEFPFDLNTLRGCAGNQATKKHDGSNWDTSYCGGTGFDLSDLGLQWIRYIRIVDTSAYLLAHPENKFYDASITGFDLDAIVGLYPMRDVELTDATESPIQDVVDIRQVGDIASIISQTGTDGTVSLYSVNGEIVLRENFHQLKELRLDALPTGVYFCTAESGGFAKFARLVVLR